MEKGRAFLPVSRADMAERGWEQCDFVYVTGDAYVDHPSFGTAIISRVLEAHGYRVGIIAQPDWTEDESIAILGEPRLGFFSLRRKYGFHGQPLQRLQETSPGGQLYPWRGDGEAAGLRGGGLREPDPPHL